MAALDPARTRVITQAVLQVVVRLTSCFARINNRGDKVDSQLLQALMVPLAGALATFQLWKTRTPSSPEKNQPPVVFELRSSDQHGCEVSQPSC